MNTINAVRRLAVTIEGDRTIRDAARLMEQSAVGALVVTDGEATVGVVTDRDLVRRAVALEVPSDARVDSVMSSPVVTIDADADLHTAYAAFASHGIRRLVVQRRGSTVGVVTVDDLLIDLANDLNQLARPVTAEAIFGQHDSHVPAER